MRRRLLLAHAEHDHDDERGHDQGHDVVLDQANDARRRARDPGLKRRDGIQDPLKNDPTGMGFYPNWAWSWPLNRRVMYNRASADLDGKPWDATRPGIKWNGEKWVGDVPDYPASGPTADPKSKTSWLPFIMTGEGVGRLFSSSMADGPFPEHYEPMESPVQNPLHPYAKGLMGAIPTLVGEDKRLVQIAGSMPRLSAIPQGCSFNPRCAFAFDRCRVERPEPIRQGTQAVACHLYDASAKDTAA